LAYANENGNSRAIQIALTGRNGRILRGVRYDKGAGVIKIIDTVSDQVRAKVMKTPPGNAERAGAVTSYPERGVGPKVSVAQAVGLI